MVACLPAVYDVTRRETFDSLGEIWMQEVDMYRCLPRKSTQLGMTSIPLTFGASAKLAPSASIFSPPSSSSPPLLPPLTLSCIPLRTSASAQTRQSQGRRRKCSEIGGSMMKHESPLREEEVPSGRGDNGFIFVVQHD